MKVILSEQYSWKSNAQKITPIRAILPFSRSRRGLYVHRIRSAHLHEWKDGHFQPHTSMTYWCGMSGFLHKSQLFANPPTGSVLCAACEGKWVGAGGDGRKINGRDVMFMPRHSGEGR